MTVKLAPLAAVLIGFCLLNAAGLSTQAAEGPGKSARNAAGSGWSAEVSSSDSDSVSLDANQTNSVKKVNEYFNSMRTLQGSFVQTGADGEVMKGKFMMKRPGMFRFDYSRPSRQVIVSDGTYLSIQDLDLKNEDRVALDQTPFRVLLRKDVDLLRDALIKEVQEDGISLQLALEDKSPDTPGRIHLVLAKGPELQLKEWTTTDAQGLDTHVEVEDVEKDNQIDASHFVIRAPGNPFSQ
jgi:outer membrane lipoprotein-sorting protein